MRSDLEKFQANLLESVRQMGDMAAARVTRPALDSRIPRDTLSHAHQDDRDLQGLDQRTEGPGSQGAHPDAGRSSGTR